MRTCIKNTRAYTLTELIIAIAIFAQILIFTNQAVVVALEQSQQNNEQSNVNLELYGIMVNGIGSYIRKATSIMYAENEPAKSQTKIGTLSNFDDPFTSNNNNSFPKAALDSFNRQCSDTRTNQEDQRIFDRLTLYLDHDKKEHITFAVEYNAEKNTSRLVWRKNDSQEGYYLNSEDTFINCFLVSPSPNPRKDKNIQDLNAYVQIEIAGYYRHDNQAELDENYAKNISQLSYRATFNLRNYYYH